MAEPVNLLVNTGVFFDIGIGLGDVGLRLVVIIVTDEIFYGVLREKLLKLTV